VWSEEVGRTPTAGAATPAAAAVEPEIPAGGEPATATATATATVRLYVNLGRKDGASAEMVAEMLSSSGVPVVPGEVELMNTHSYVNVPSQASEPLCTAMSGRTHNGRSVVCEPARPPKRRY
jgi:hypothetical protein